MNLFTIITVCYNAENEIKRTIESVLKQTYTNYEYLIVDGLSSDRTVEIAESYCDQFAKKGITYTIKSEKDTGIYNAMNKATDMASGKWLLFLNAGDWLVDENVLEEVAKRDQDDVTILYGDVIYTIDGLYRKEPKRDLDYLKTGMAFCHQSAFIAREKMAEYRYDESYRIAGDYDFICRCYVNDEKIEYMPIIVSIFELGGASRNLSTNMFEILKVQYRCGFITEHEYKAQVKKWEMLRMYYAVRHFLLYSLPRNFFLQMKKKKYRTMGYTEQINHHSA